MITKRNEFTHRLLVDAGIKTGMRVLDIGCGSGEVTLLAAALVGDHGSVLGVDRNNDSLGIARKTASDNQVRRVDFLLAELDDLTDHVGQFDAIIGRRVLMYQPDAVHSIRKLLPYLKNNGLLVFQESDSLSVGFSPVPMPLHSQAQSWTWKTVEKEGGDIHMGSNLFSTLRKAGLYNINVRAEIILETSETESDLAWLIKTMLPRITQRGIATEDEIGIATLEHRLHEERQKANAAFIRDMTFGAWVEYKKAP